MDCRKQILTSCFPASHTPRLVSRDLKNDHDQLIHRISVSHHLCDLPFISRFPMLTAIDMSSCSQVLPEGALASALQAMSHIPTLQTLILSTWIIARPAPKPTTAQNTKTSNTPLWPTTTTASTTTSSLSSSMVSKRDSSSSKRRSSSDDRASSSSNSNTSSRNKTQVAAQDCTYHLALPADIGALTQLTRLVIRPCQGLASPKLLSPSSQVRYDSTRLS